MRLMHAVLYLLSNLPAVIAFFLIATALDIAFFDNTFTTALFIGDYLRFLYDVNFFFDDQFFF